MITVNVGNSNNVGNSSTARVTLMGVTRMHPGQVAAIDAIKAVRMIAMEHKLGALEGLKEAKDFVVMFKERVEEASSRWENLVIESPNFGQMVLDKLVAMLCYYLHVRYVSRVRG